MWQSLLQSLCSGELDLFIVYFTSPEGGSTFDCLAVGLCSHLSVYYWAAEQAVNWQLVCDFERLEQQSRFLAPCDSGHFAAVSEHPVWPAM